MKITEITVNLGGLRIKAEVNDAEDIAQAIFKLYEMGWSVEQAWNSLGEDGGYTERKQ